jgi:hypothetical protein
MPIKDIQQKRAYERQYYANNSDLRKKKIKAQSLRRKANAIAVIEYLKSHQCIDCDESDTVVLQFDHVIGKKIYEVTTMIWRGFSLEKIFEEIEKCVVRCANCHRRKTAKQLGWYAYIS